MLKTVLLNIPSALTQLDYKRNNHSHPPTSKAWTRKVYPVVSTHLDLKNLDSFHSEIKILLPFLMEQKQRKIVNIVEKDSSKILNSYAHQRRYPLFSCVVLVSSMGHSA